MRKATFRDQLIEKRYLRSGGLPPPVAGIKRELIVSAEQPVPARSMQSVEPQPGPQPQPKEFWFNTNTQQFVPRSPPRLVKPCREEEEEESGLYDIPEYHANVLPWGHYRDLDRPRGMDSAPDGLRYSESPQKQELKQSFFSAHAHPTAQDSQGPLIDPASRGIKHHREL